MEWVWTAQGVAKLAEMHVQADFGRPREGDEFSEEHLWIMKSKRKASITILESEGVIKSSVDTATVPTAPAAQAGGAETSDKDFTPGLYLITDTAELTVELDRYSDSIDDLAVGTKVNVVEVQPFGTFVRGRLESPKGWISLMDTDDGYKWVKQQAVTPSPAGPAKPVGPASPAGPSGAGGVKPAVAAPSASLKQHLLADGSMVLKSPDGTIYNFRSRVEMGKWDPKRNAVYKPFEVGNYAAFTGLKNRADLNGCTAQLTEYFAAEDKWECLVLDGDSAGDSVRVKPSNVVPADPPKGALPTEPAPSNFAPPDRIAPNSAPTPAMPETKTGTKQVVLERWKRANLPLPAHSFIAVAGTWTDWSVQKMQFDPLRHCHFSVFILGSSGWESFQLLVDGHWKLCIHPDRADATQFEKHVLCVDDQNHGKNWTLGQHKLDKYSPGTQLEVRLIVAENGCADRVEWSMQFSQKGGQGISQTETERLKKAMAQDAQKYRSRRSMTARLTQQIQRSQMEYEEEEEEVDVPKPGWVLLKFIS